MATDYLLEIDGIKGESKDKKFKDTIEVESFSWGATNSGSFASGHGGGTGVVSFQDLHFTSKVCKASPLLMLSCATGKHIAKAVLHVRKAGGEQEEYYIITLNDVLISSYQSGDAAGGDAIPTDQFSLNFAKIKYEYKPQDEKGKLGTAVEGSWNLKERVK
jgi:type VI secretion system secreted protein Hcp